jgi:cation diffusion facilitator CzcD-associated flavoprotein CzcO
MSQIYKCTIVGTGAAGLLALLLFSQESKIQPEEILCIDPHHDGGDLQRLWSSVYSNTTWSQLLAIFPSTIRLPERWASLDPSAPTSLSNYIQCLRYVVKDYLTRCEVVYGTVTDLTPRDESKCITVHCRTNTNEQLQFKSKTVLITTGSEAKRGDLPIPCIPLSAALHTGLLSTYVQPGQHVTVFGTAHSGTIILKNLHTLGARTTAFYKTSTPFLFARDGEYDGIKQESQTIADEILSGVYTQTQLIPLTNTAQLIRAAKKSDWVIYATGFTPRGLQGRFCEYDGHTGKLVNLEGVWGFGIAYPNIAEDGIHKDVSIPSFYTHIRNQMPTILESFYA